MWSALRTRRSVLVSGSVAYVREAARPWSSTAVEVATCSLDDLGRVLAGLSKLRFGADLDVTMGSALCRFMTVPRPPGIVKDDDVRAVLQAHAAKKLGLKEVEWTLAIDNRMRSYIFTCAIRSTILKSLHLHAEASRHRITSIKPLAVRFSDPRSNLAWMVVESDAVSLASIQGREASVISARLGQEDAATVIERLRLSAGGHPSMKTMRLDVAHQGTKHLDFRDLLVDEPTTP